MPTAEAKLAEIVDHVKAPSASGYPYDYRIAGGQWIARDYSKAQLVVDLETLQQLFEAESTE